MTSTISRTDLARRTRQAIEQAQRGQAVFIESYGAEQVAIVDVLDYRLLRAAATFRSQMSAPVNNPDLPPAGLTETAVQARVAAAAGDVQEAWNMIIAAYLAGDISLGRTATLLNMSRFELLARFNRFGLPMRMGALSIHEAQAEYETIQGKNRT
ncbi:hypothetical protein [Candidatus Amarolinea dominans]|uniref:hypothetical protein n=1 Tax=Candidatus Amarolinea dominans TaxID=3140696 RepID=UPI001DFBD0BD|nr:UPF0175 family protein [Anaerolineae bacterium]MBK7204351.1 UPF0175 family protein [Anaerolineae bacterium]MBK9094566.1 UPF0175 family protein [Anaerolineae bacterium]MBK9232446.1 UPF0175 family protein [Anaerolineae bacterium]